KLGNYSVYKGSYSISAKDGEYDSKPFWSESGKTTESGGFYGSFKISENAAPGYYSITYRRDENNNNFYGQTIYFQIANFRRLNFQVNMQSPNIEYYKDDSINTTLNASYLSGGVLGGAGYDYYWIKSVSYFKPAGNNWNSYRFGSYDYQADENLSTGNGKLSGSGSATLKQNASGEFKKGLTYSYSCYANVTDIDRQVISTSKSIIVHPASMYLGMKFRSSDGYWSPFVTKGSSVTVDYALVKPDGSEYSPKSYNKLNVKVYRIEWKLAQQKGVYDRINTLYQREETLESEQNINVNSFNGNFTIKPEKSGEYILRAETKDNKERTAYTEFSFYSTGSDWVRWGGENAEGINLMLEKPSYKVGETARIMLQSPLPKGKYLVTIEREGIFEEKIYDFSGS
ncbi:MAG TPA: alpha-2-macroglobulin, partial [Spirochaetota bacterium]|nr:alpha-2-macroglobulin [Spirochaetota bacterium]